MNDIKIEIDYRDGKHEETYIDEFSIKDNCLKMSRRYGETRFIPLDLIREWRVR